MEIIEEINADKPFESMENLSKQHQVIENSLNSEKIDEVSL